jgi:hypothetical protein
MVRAILSGAKTQTRRVVKGTALEWLAPDMFTPDFVADPANSLCPFGAPGDLLWVREAWAPVPALDGAYPHHAVYRADGRTETRWRPSIHMPRWASRLTLRVTSVRVERLQAITEEDARAEGVAADDISRVGVPCYSARQNFERLWDSLAAEGSRWRDDPWVWVIGFERAESAKGRR